ncbi:hypothetical protein [Halocatena marina]|uniref:Lipoprotein n=1 Tax=Halocatena marina TaxID=2934937 RepID=A0ABD5YT03_9EURY|nr:hypothetical protein [Halocatena marina]
MNRRSFVGLLAGSLTAMAGCLGRSGVTGSNVEHIEPRRNREQRPTIVAFDEAASAVHITGHMVYGSSSCDKVGISSTTYDAEANSLRIVMESQSKNPIPFLSSVCTANVAGTWYRATVQFADELPQKVTVVEQRGSNEKRVVNRHEQQQLCTTNHPPDSPDAKEAHWTCPEQYVANSVRECGGLPESTRG